MTNVAGKVAIVLGASAQNGIGWACAERLKKEGAEVVVGARSFNRLKALAEPAGMLAVACDAQKRVDIEKLANAALQKFGRVDIAVNSAGAGELVPVSEVTEEVMRRALDMNYIPMVNFVQVMTKAMGVRADDNLGSIVLVSTLSVEHPMPPVFAYAAAKAATDTLVRYAALEYGPQRIKINSINPGLVITDLAKQGMGENLEAVEAVVANCTPLRRVALPADCADAVFWLASSAFVTGLHLKVCGGGQLREQFG